MERTELSLTTYRCYCKKPKTHRLLVDGGYGHYILELCEDCHRSENKAFVVRDEKIKNE